MSGLRIFHDVNISNICWISLLLKTCVVFSIIYRKKLQMHSQLRTFFPCKWINVQLIKRQLKTRCQEHLKFLSIRTKIWESRTFQPISNKQRKSTETSYWRCRGIFIRRWACLSWTNRSGACWILTIIFILCFRFTKLG